MYGDLEEDRETLLSWQAKPRLVRLVSGGATFMTLLWLTPLILSFGGDGGVSTISWWSFPVMATGLLGLFAGFVLFINGLYYKPKTEPVLISFDPETLQTCTFLYNGEKVHMVKDDT